MTELSEAAVSMLVNAAPRTGGRLGNGDAADELCAAGLATTKGCLTAKGAAQALALQADQWPAQRPEMQLWEPPPTGLSEDAVDSLLHAHRRTGGQPGIASEQTLAELRTAGMLSSHDNLTAQGAAMARQLQDDRWPDGRMF